KLFQLAVDPCQFGPRLLFSQVPLAVQGPGELFDLAAEQPQPRVPMHCGGPVLQFARVDRPEDLILRPAILRVHGLVAQRRALSSPFSIVKFHHLQGGTTASTCSHLSAEKSEAVCLAPRARAPPMPATWCECRLEGTPEPQSSAASPQRQRALAGLT